ncbi:hypothetical protein FACS189416_1860 [Bacteroidia bacterium]|nr:hypothetical protein FACS189416_1860 [Bacteroidia bacterium]
MRTLILSLIILFLGNFYCASETLPADKGDGSEKVQTGWTNLLDESLSQWRIYQSYENMGANGKPVPYVDGTVPEPIGFDTNLRNLYSVIKENGELVLHVNGKVYGCAISKQVYRNYHLKLQYKFGTHKYLPRLDKALDSGVLYHSQGDPGVDHWHSWMQGQEFQVMEAGTDEGVTGDYWPIAGSRVSIHATLTGERKYIYDPKGELLNFGGGNPRGFCAAATDNTSPKSEWTILELYCYEGTSFHVVNGKVVMILENSSYWNGSESLPLLEGKIQLQCEAGEVYFKNIQIQEITELPILP